MAKVVSIRANDAYEAHFERDEKTGEIVRLRFGDQVYETGPTRVQKRYEPLSGNKLNRYDGLEAEVRDKEALRLIDRIEINDRPVAETAKGHSYTVDFDIYNQKFQTEGMIPYFRVTENGERIVKIWAGPPGLSFQELKKGDNVFEGKIYSAAKIDRIYIPK